MPATFGDIVEVEQLIAAFNHAVDFGDGPTFASLFVDDGVLDMGHLTITGHDELVAFADGVPVRVPNPRHVVTNVWVTVDGDTAVARSYARVHVTPPGEPTSLRAAGRYLDDLVRRSERWVFARRTFVADPE